ncbi:MAG: CoA transferase [Acidobacteria bacterium]|nr:CoA transferase [Acidobacteriota bacterium]
MIAQDLDEGGPLAGVRVLDLSTGIAGAMAAMLLGDLGADVVRGEPPAGPDLHDDPGRLCWHRNKTLVTIDVEARDGAAEARRLLGATDVVVVDQPMPDVERHQLDADRSLADNPSVIHVWLPPYGERGRWSSLPADAMVLAVVTGLSDLYNATEDVPVVPVVPVLAYEQGALGAALAIAGLLRRAEGHGGQSVVVSGLHSVAAMLAAVLADAPRMVERPKSATSALPHYRHYRCADGQWIYLGSLTQPFFLAALDAMELLELMVTPGIDGEFSNLMVPALARPVTARLEQRFAERDRDEWLKLLRSVDVPCAPVDTREAWFDSETISANGLRAHRSHPVVGAVDLPAVPFWFSDATVGIRALPDDRPRAAAGECWTEERAQPGPSAPASATSARPLAGLRVLDLSSFIAGAFGPSILANLGADVIKVETPSGDPYRGFMVSWTAFNQSKRGLGLDLKKPDGHAAFIELVRQADVVVDSARPGVRARLGIEFESLRAINPRLVRCSMTGWGEHGPLADTQAFDPLIQARSGLMAAQGGDDDPVFSSMLVHDIGTGTLAAAGILAALYQRLRTGEGQEVKLSLASSSVVLQAGELVRFAGRRPADVGGRNWAGPSTTRRLYHCADGWVAVAADGDALSPIVDAVGAVSAADLEAGFAAQTTAEVLERLAAIGVTVASVLRRQLAITDPWLAENGFFHTVEQPDIGTSTVVSGYASWRGCEVGYEGHAPAIGEHTREILREIGMDDARIDGLLASGALAETPIASTT